MHYETLVEKNKLKVLKKEYMNIFISILHQSGYKPIQDFTDSIIEIIAE